MFIQEIVNIYYEVSCQTRWKNSAPALLDQKGQTPNADVVRRGEVSGAREAAALGTFPGI